MNLDLKSWLKNHHYSTNIELSDQTPVSHGVIRGYNDGMQVLCHIMGYHNDIVPVKIIKRPNLF